MIWEVLVNSSKWYFFFKSCVVYSLSLEFGRGEGKEMQVEAEENDFLFVKSGYFCF